MSFEDYAKACKMGKKDYQRHVSKGMYPYLQALEESISHIDIVSEVKLGLCQLPAELIAGTKTAGRRTAFAPNFMPLLDSHSEFAGKWIRLCDSHLKEGIREPVTAYEFMGRFYIEEGNKRVSVLKYFDAPSIPAIVTRMVPRRSDDPDNIIYYEYMNFYQHSRVNYVLFSKTGSFQKLSKAVTGSAEEVWSEEQRMHFSSNYIKFKNAFLTKGGEHLLVTLGDALLTYILVYGYESLNRASTTAVKENISRVWAEFKLLEEEQSVELLMNPADTAPKKKLIDILIPSAPKQMKIAFIHSKSAESSSWTYAHELGRRHVEEVFPEQLETLCFDNIAPGEDCYKTIEQAIRIGCNIVFTTTPEFIPSSLKAAVEYSNIKILNCSLNTSHRYIRTYYGRMYEAKFLCGIIAGSLADNNRIGYIADYPVYGMTANINAFALGARLVNPRAEVFLKWSTVEDDDIMEYFKKERISYVSSQDMIVPRYASRQYGLYRLDGLGTGTEGTAPYNAATPLWNWGKFYEKIIRSIMSGSWEEDDSSDTARAINYWWGLSSGVVDLIYSQNLSVGTKRLVEFAKRGIESSDFHPFSGILYSQSGVIQGDENHILAPEEIITMDWLAENVVGSIPDFSMLTEAAKQVVHISGIKKEYHL